MIHVYPYRWLPWVKFTYSDEHYASHMGGGILSVYKKLYHEPRTQLEEDDGLLGDMIARVYQDQVVASFPVGSWQRVERTYPKDPNEA